MGAKSDATMKYARMANRSTIVVTSGPVATAGSIRSRSKARGMTAPTVAETNMLEQMLNPTVAANAPVPGSP